MWIKVDGQIYDNPKIVKLARRLSINPVCAVGHMVALWTWCLNSCPDGELTDLDAEDLAILARWDGDAEEFVKALEAVRLLDRSGERLLVHDWDEFSGSLKSAQKQKRYRERKRETSAPPLVTDGNALRNVTKPLVTVTSQREREREREREKENKTHTRSSASAECARVVWGKYRDYHPKAALKPSDKTKKLIAARSKEGFTPAQLCEAIDGLHLDPWEGRKDHLAIHYALKDADSVQKFLEIAEARASPAKKRWRPPKELVAIGDRFGLGPPLKRDVDKLNGTKTADVEKLAAAMNMDRDASWTKLIGQLKTKS